MRIWKIFQNTDVAIASGGNTLFELAIQGVPTICVPVVAHQQPYAKTLEKLGFCINIGSWKMTKQSILTKSLIGLLENDNKRYSMNKIGRKFCDGNGISRIIKIIEHI
jgi:spore coat polysaccharide biosynthesis predicted glycosyltransferase SpsG